MPARRTPVRPLLLTGFEPFGGDSTNASWVVARTLHGESIAGARVVALQLPCVFGTAMEVMRQAIAEHRPQLVLALGLAPTRSVLSVERVAINVDDARIADNAGAQPIDLPVLPGGPAAYFSTLPIKAIVQALLQAGVPAEVSQSAGTFVCNHLFYGLMHALRRQPAVRGGFMHVPPLQGPGAMDVALQVQGVRLALQTGLQTASIANGDSPIAAGDVRITGGAIA